MATPSKRSDGNQGDTGARLLAAAQVGDVNTIKKLVEHAGIDLETTDAGGATALVLAVHHRQVQVAKVLLQAGANVDAADASGHTALMRASELVNDLFGPAHYRTIQCDLIRLLLEAKAKLELVDVDGKTALLYAAKYHDTNPVRMLLEANANVNARDSLGDTPLLVASRIRAIENMRMLLEAGAKVNATNIAGDTPLIDAMKTPFFFSSVQSKVARLLLEAGANVQVGNMQGQTALHLAAMHGQVETVNELLEAGAIVDARCCKGNTALIYAVDCGNHVEVVLSLLQAGADPSIANRLGKSVMSLLAEEEDQLRAKVIQQALHYRNKSSANGAEPSNQVAVTSIPDAMASSQRRSQDEFEVISNTDTASIDCDSSLGESHGGDFAHSLVRVAQTLAEGTNSKSMKTVGEADAPFEASSHCHQETAGAVADESAVIERTDDNGMVTFAVLDPREQSECPVHRAVLASEGDAECFEDLIDSITADLSAVADVRLITRSKSVKELCAVEYAHSIGYHDIGRYLATKMNSATQLDLDASKAVSVKLLDDATDFSFVYAVQKSKGSVQRCTLLLDDDEGEEGDEIDRRIRAEVVSEVDTRTRSWSPLELACQLGYLGVVNSLLKWNARIAERKPVIRARALERAEALGLL